MFYCEVKNENTVVYSTEWKRETIPEELFEKARENKKTYTMDIVSKVAYLGGLNRSFFEKEENPLMLSVYEDLEKSVPAKRIRTLSKIRMQIIRNFDKVHSGLTYDMKNLNSMPDIFDTSEIRWLEKNGVPLIKVNYRISNYQVDINNYIAQNINDCKSIFPLWVEFDYIRNLFIMPKGNNPAYVKCEGLKYLANLNDYPYHLYFSWAPKEAGNWLYNDNKFLQVLYNHNGNQFFDYKKVTDASVSTKKSIYSYLDENQDTVLIVDCENSNPFKLYASFKSLNEEELGKLKKVILIDDVHSSTAWQLLERFLNIPVVHIMVERVNDFKSLVDMKLTIEVSKEHYANGVNSFILCSSDSDFWPLMSSLQGVSFLVMMENYKIGDDLIREMDNSGIPYFSLDQFSDGNINEIKTKALTKQVERYIAEHVNLNVNDMLTDAYNRTRITMTDKEKQQFYNSYIKNMRLTIQPDGSVKVVLKQQ